MNKSYFKQLVTFMAQSRAWGKMTDAAIKAFAALVSAKAGKAISEIRKDKLDNTATEVVGDIYALIYKAAGVTGAKELKKKDPDRMKEYNRVANIKRLFREAYGLKDKPAKAAKTDKMTKKQAIVEVRRLVKLFNISINDLLA